MDGIMYARPSGYYPSPLLPATLHHAYLRWFRRVSLNITREFVYSRDSMPDSLDLILVVLPTAIY